MERVEIVYEFKVSFMFHLAFVRFQPSSIFLLAVREEDENESKQRARSQIKMLPL